MQNNKDKMLYYMMIDIINGKKVTKTETTTVDSNGNKKTVVREETGDGKVTEYLLGENGKKEPYKEIESEKKIKK